MNVETLKQNLPVFERELSRRYAHARQLLVEMREGRDVSELDLGLAVGDLQSLLNAVAPPEEEG